MHVDKHREHAEVAEEAQPSKWIRTWDQRTYTK